MEDLIIIASILVLVAALVVTGVSVAHSLKANRRPKTENGVPSRLIALAVAGGVALLLLLTGLLGDIADMFIISATVMLMAATASLLYGRVQTVMKRRHV